MKIKLLNTIIQAGTNITFHKGKTYNASAATNQKRAIRFVNKKTDISISKVFVQRGADSMLVEEDDFVIIDFPKNEHDALFQKYYDSKTLNKKVKKVYQYKIRDGYRPIEFNKKDDKKDESIKYNLHSCDMGKGRDGKCGRDAKFVKVIKRPGRTTLRICACDKCGVINY